MGRDTTRKASGVDVTHDQEGVLTMSDRIAVMHDGRIERLGTATEIYEEPATEFVADFIGETNQIRGTYGETVRLGWAADNCVVLSE
nr:hypothetical protein [Halopenitus persicus]